LTGNHRRRASWRRTILGDFSTRHPVSPKFRASVLRLLQTPHSPVGIPAHPRCDSALDATVTSAKKRLLWKVGTGMCVLDRQTRQGGPLSRGDPKQRSRTIAKILVGAEGRLAPSALALRAIARWRAMFAPPSMAPQSNGAF
jgi:hypothetical protein